MSIDFETTFDDIEMEDLQQDLIEEQINDEFHDACKIFNLNPKKATWEEIEELQEVARLEDERNRIFFKSVMLSY